MVFGLGADRAAVLGNVPGHRNRDPHERRRRQEQNDVQNTHRGQHNKLKPE